MADRSIDRVYRPPALAAFIPILNDKKADIDKIERQELKYGQRNRHYVRPLPDHRVHPADPSHDSSTYTTPPRRQRCPRRAKSSPCSSSSTAGVTTRDHAAFRSRTRWATARSVLFSPRKGFWW